MFHRQGNNPIAVPGAPDSTQLPPSIPDHELLRCIGRGAYGEVWLAKTVMGTFRAVKVIHRKSFRDERPYEREFNGLRKYEPVSRNHPGLVGILHSGLNAAAGYFYCVMELADDEHTGQKINPQLYKPKTLNSELARLQKLPLERCIEVGRKLAAGLHHLHENGLVHRSNSHYG